MRAVDFDYDLPAELIAQAPLPERDQSRLLVMHRPTGQCEHRAFPDLLHYLQPGDVLVLNNSKVIPARLRGSKTATGGQFEILLLEENQTNDWWVMMRPAKRMRPGTRLCFHAASGARSDLTALVVEKNSEGQCRLQFAGNSDVRDRLEELGEIPLPPYITRSPNTGQVNDRDRYQTVYAVTPGSVAAPTAGLHFTPSLLERLGRFGIQVCYVTLHVGPGTFAPVKAERLIDHPMHEERFDLSQETVQRILTARQAGHRIIAVGTTTVRVLESVAAQNQGQLPPTRSSTRLFIYPPFVFRIVDALLTNFHLPKSTLLMLVCAFAAPGNLQGRERVLAAYANAMRRRYRFFSYGDAMLLL